MPTKTTPKRPAASAAKKTPAKAVKATKAVAKKAPAKVAKVTRPAAKKAVAKVTKSNGPVAKKAPAKAAKATKVTRPAAKKAVAKAPVASMPVVPTTIVTTAKAVREAVLPKPFKPGRVDARMPGEQHPGQTSVESRLHDRAGSQLERERHMHPGSTNPKSGAGRTNKRAVKKGR